MTDTRTSYCVACKEMADRIEELTTEATENARIIGMSAEREMALRGEIERLRNAMVVMDNTMQELTEALWEIEMFTNGYGDVAGIVHKMAGDTRRAALEGKSND